MQGGAAARRTVQLMLDSEIYVIRARTARFAVGCIWICVDHASSIHLAAAERARAGGRLICRWVACGVRWWCIEKQSLDFSVPVGGTSTQYQSRPRSSCSLLLMAQPSASDLPDDEKVILADEKGSDSDVPNINSGRKRKPGEPLSASWRTTPLSTLEAGKVMQILRACKDRDRQALSALAATPAGFVEDQLRRAACMYRSCPHERSPSDHFHRDCVAWRRQPRARKRRLAGFTAAP